MSAARADRAVANKAAPAAAKSNVAKPAAPEAAHDFGRCPAPVEYDEHAGVRCVLDLATAAAEREADAMAARSLREAVARAVRGTTPHVLSERELALAPPEVVEGVTSPAVPLDSTTRSYFEPRLHVSLDRVRVHAGSAAERSAAALRARAYAFGEHVVFAAHSYAPHTAAGRALLAHELAHVAQQGVQGRSFLGRKDWRDPERPDEKVTELAPGGGLISRSGPGYLTVEGIELTYLRVEWDPRSPPPDFQFVLKDLPKGQGIGLRLKGTTRVKVTLDRRFEVPAGDIYRLFSYDFDLPGELQFERASEVEPQHPPVPLPWRFRHLVPPRPYGELPPPTLLDPPKERELEPFPDSRLRLAPRDTSEADRARADEQEMVRGQAAFRTRRDMEEHIRKHPEKTFIGIETTYGKFVARAIDEREMIALARELRGDPDRLPEVAWDVTGKRSAWKTTGVYQRGQRLDPESLHDLYYGSVFEAREGVGGDLEECEVFRMGPQSFGRKPLTHDEAVRRWSELDGLDRRAIDRLMTAPGRPFVALRVRGVGKAHNVDADYFDGREEFRKRAPLLRGLTSPSEVIVRLLSGSDTSNANIYYYVLAEADRERTDPAFLATLREHESLAEAVSSLIYDRVEERAQKVALEAVAEARGQLAPLADELDRARAFVIGFPDMGEKARKDALAFIGVPESERGFVLEMLGDRETAWRIALGLDESRTERKTMRVVDDLPSKTRIDYTVTRRFSLDMLRGWAATSVEGLDKARTQLAADRALALWLEGELGNRVREQVYREFGFNLLKPDGFPHGKETEGWSPSPLHAGKLPFSSLAEQMFANRVRGKATKSTLMKVLAVTLLVIVTVILILIAQGVGLAAAGLLFAEGSAAFIATELIVSGVVFTGLSAVQHRMTEGEWQSPLDLIGQGALNIATFGAFRFLNTFLAAGAKSFVAARVQSGFFAAERAGAWATGLRIGLVGTSFMGIGIAQRLASGKGFESAGDFALFAYENLLTIALLEAGAVAGRPLMERGSIWAREVRLGALELPITQLRADLVRLQRNVASLSMRPEAAPRDAPRLIGETRALLVRQRALVEQLRQRFRTRSDAAQLEKKVGAELEAIDTALAGIEQAEFLIQLKIKPVKGSESVYTYEGGAPAIDRFKQFYGEERVRVEADGTLRAEVKGLDTRELVFVPAEKYGTPATGATTPPAVPPLVQRQLALQARQQAVLSRAKLLGIQHSTLNEIRRKQPVRQTDPKTLQETENLIARAEKEAGAVMDTLTKNILKNVTDRLGKGALDQIRAGELRDVTDAQLADVLYQARGMHNMGVAQLRALVFAARPGVPPINFPKLLQTIHRGKFNVSDRNFALETFTQLMELRVAGTRQMLADMSVSPSKFRGGLFQMEAMRFVGGVEQVAGIEIREPLGNRAREYDITLRDGTRIECKDWLTWEYADGLGSQFVRDMRLLTNNFFNPAGMRRMRYLFRSPPPRSVENIRAFLRARLERELANEWQSLREAMLREFDAYADLVQAPQLQRSGGLPLPPPGTPLPSPAWPDDEAGDEDEAGGPSPP